MKRARRVRAFQHSTKTENNMKSYFAYTLGVATVAAAFCMPMHAYSMTIATSTNSGGGRIELTDIKIPADADDLPGCQGAFIAKSWGKRGSDLFGCWIPIGEDDEVVVRWSDGDIRTYPMSKFIRTKQAQRALDTAKGRSRN